MKTVIVEYATISPSVLVMRVESAFSSAICQWKDLDEDYFEFTVFGVDDLLMLENILAEYV